MRVLAYLAALFLCCATSASAQTDFKGEAERYLQDIAKDLVTTSKEKTPERRAFWISLIGEKIDWREPARFALKDRWQGLSAVEQAALARWAKEEILAETSVFGFLQNLIPRNCVISDSVLVQEALTARLRCSLLYDTVYFAVKLEVRRVEQGDLRITDAEYIGISLREEMGKAIHKRFQEHGVAFALK